MQSSCQSQLVLVFSGSAKLSPRPYKRKANPPSMGVCHLGPTSVPEGTP